MADLNHLGGHGNVTHLDEGLIKWVVETFSPKTALDIGCGPGGMVKLISSFGVSVKGLDGDPSVSPDILVDFSKTDYYEEVDWGYSCEFVEHVEEEYQANYMKAFSGCKFVTMTFAPPKTPGYHHVNCRTPQYWIDVFSKYGFVYSKELTQEMRQASTMTRHFVRRNGLCFLKDSHMQQYLR